MKFGEAVRAFRLGMAISQAKAAEKAGIPRVRWTRIEKTDNPTLETINKTAAALDMKPSELIQELEKHDV